MNLRDWVGPAWAKPGVSGACLALQDDQGQCVPLLLWALWLSNTARGVDDAAIDGAVALCRAAEADVIGPLRAARRAAASPERDRLLAEELRAEHDLLDRLEALAGTGRPASEDQLADLSARWGNSLGPPAFEPLIKALHAREPADVG